MPILQIYVYLYIFSFHRNLCDQSNKQNVSHSIYRGTGKEFLDCSTLSDIDFLFLLHFCLLLSSVMAKETSIDLRIVDARLLEFPAATICNANPIEESTLEELVAGRVQIQ